MTLRRRAPRRILAAVSSGVHGPSGGVKAGPKARRTNQTALSRTKDRPIQRALPESISSGLAFRVERNPIIVANRQNPATPSRGNPTQRVGRSMISPPQVGDPVG